MKITTSDLTQDRQWSATLGMTKKRFFVLLEHFKNAYFETYKAELSKRKVEVNIGYCINSEEELLLFTLFSLKSGMTYDVLGVVCGMSGSNAKRNQEIGLKILVQTLTKLKAMPERKLLTVKDFQEFFKEEKDLIIDATEQHTQRPSDDEQQKETYSGKKKPT
ncbi:hypothetical protein, partial [Thiospirillum jenense]